MGLISTAKYRDTVTGKLSMKICEDIKPYIGYANPNFGLIAVGTKSPNLAKLFLRFMMTEEGIAPMTRDGKVSGNNAVPRHPEGSIRRKPVFRPFDTAQCCHGE